MRYPLIAAALALAACAPTDTAAPGAQAAAGERAPRTCFLPQQVVNFREADGRTLYLRTLGGDVFEVNAGGCLDLGTSYGLAITPTIGVNDRLCVGDGARIALSNPSPAQSPCFARVTRSLTPAEVEALPSRDRP